MFKCLGQTIYMYDKNAPSGLGLKKGAKDPFLKDEGGESKYTLGSVYIHELMYYNYSGDFEQAR